MSDWDKLTIKRNCIAPVLITCLLLFVPTAISAEGFGIAQMQREQEDGRLYDQMGRCSRWLNDYLVFNQHFPEYGAEMTFVKQQLNQLTPNSPYTSNTLRLAHGIDTEPEYSNSEISPVEGDIDPNVAATGDRIELVFDPSLTELEVENWKTDPPYEWSAPAGTITAISNNQNLYIIWGAGADGKPLKDPSNHSMLMYVGHYNMLYENQQ